MALYLGLCENHDRAGYILYRLGEQLSPIPAENVTRAWARRGEWTPAERTKLLELAERDRLERWRRDYEGSLARSREKSDRNLPKGAPAAGSKRTRRAIRRAPDETPAARHRRERAERNAKLRAYAEKYARERPDRSLNDCARHAINTIASAVDPVTEKPLSSKQVQRIIRKSWQDAVATRRASAIA